MEYLLLDTNVYLSFYKYSDIQLEWLKTILELIKKWDFKLLLPEQIILEIRRNRERKISESIKEIKWIWEWIGLPRICDHYSEKIELLEKIKELRNIKEKLISRILEEENSQTLRADLLLKDIEDVWISLQTTDIIYNKAIKRFNIWNPPWKNNSYWDAIIRESLLSFDNKENWIVFVSLDWDFWCSLNDNRIEKFLEHEREYEWKKWKLKFYRKLKDFFTDYDIPVILNDEFLLERLIKKITFECNSFNEAREIVREISELDYDIFNKKNIEDLMIASLNNNQVYWAHNYWRSSWLWERFCKLIKEKWWNLENEMIDDFNEKFKYSLEHNLPF